MFEQMQVKSNPADENRRTPPIPAREPAPLTAEQALRIAAQRFAVPEAHSVSKLQLWSSPLSDGCWKLHASGPYFPLYTWVSAEIVMRRENAATVYSTRFIAPQKTTAIPCDTFEQALEKLVSGFSNSENQDDGKGHP
jgi:hypothetical protein